MLIYGTNQSEIIEVDGSNSSYVIYGLDGHDDIYAWTGNDHLYGGSGDDILSGYFGDDCIYGESGNDILVGGSGDDYLVGGSGNDYLVGGTGADGFVFSYETEGIDIIQDFNWLEGDKILIDTLNFGATSNNQFSYDNSTGALSFDASLNDDIAATTFAILENKPLAFSTNLDIVLV